MKSVQVFAIAALAATLGGCAMAPPKGITQAQLESCRAEKCVLMTVTQFKEAVVGFVQQAVEPVYVAGVEEGVKSCRRISI